MRTTFKAIARHGFYRGDLVAPGEELDRPPIEAHDLLMQELVYLVRPEESNALREAVNELTMHEIGRAARSSRSFATSW